jgi:mannose-1-phosphate guanylyltransferase
MDRAAIVLAGGEGVRLRRYVLARFGEPRPKQYCAFLGPRSMLEHTLDRAQALAANVVTVIAEHHRPWAQNQLDGRGGTVVCQPRNCETAPGLYLPLAYVRARTPEAVVHVLPSDHFVQPSTQFVAEVRRAGEHAASHPDRLVLTGVTPEGPEPAFGYVVPRGAARGVQPVARFVEKPSLEVATEAIARGGMWNTMVIAATVDALWEAGRASIPAMIDRFDELVRHVGTRAEQAVLAEIYREMPSASFSRAVLERVPDRCVVTRLAGVEWSDWGAPERIEATLARRGADLRKLA